MTAPDSPQAPLDVRVDDDGLHLRDVDDARLDVHLDGRRVWSCLLSRDGRRLADGSVLVSWPAALVPHLDGVADVVVEDLDHGRRAATEVRFGDGTGRVDLTDSHGRPLVVDKGGRVKRNFAGVGDEVRATLVDGVADAISLLHDHGVEAFLTYGCLLGAVREGRLIAHDDDADISYLSNVSHPFDVMRESFRLERVFVEAGWETRRMSGADFKVVTPERDRHVVAVDVFACFRRDHELLLMPNVRTTLPDSVLVPTSTVVLEGRELPAPGDPDAILEAAYGPDWRIPDPTFKPAWERTSRRRTSGWMRGERRNLRYWNNHYAAAGARSGEGSSFARWVAEREQPGRLLDVGCGDGTDALYLAARGFDVLGVDFSQEALKIAHAAAEGRQSPARFARLNLYDLRHVLARGTLLTRDHRPSVVTARLLVDSLTADGRTNLWRLARSALAASRGRLYLELATRPTPSAPGGKYRDYVDVAQVDEELAGYGLVVEDSAPVAERADDGDEPPAVWRVVARMEG